MAPTAYKYTLLDSDSRIDYSTGWMAVSVNPLSASVTKTDHYTSVPGSYAKFDFNGTAVSAVFDVTSTAGLVSFQVDDAPPTFRNYSESQAGPKVWQSAVLDPNFQHTLTITNTGINSSMKLSYINFQPATEESTTRPALIAAIFGCLCLAVIACWLFKWQLGKLFTKRSRRLTAFPESMYPSSFKGPTKASTGLRPLSLQALDAVPRYTQAREGPTENIIATKVPAVSRHDHPNRRLNYTFTRAPLSLDLDKDTISVRQPPPIHAGWGFSIMPLSPVLYSPPHHRSASAPVTPLPHHYAPHHRTASTSSPLRL